jgi:hypothetical protein
VPTVSGKATHVNQREFCYCEARVTTGEKQPELGEISGKSQENSLDSPKEVLQGAQDCLQNKNIPLSLSHLFLSVLMTCEPPSHKHKPHQLFTEVLRLSSKFTACNTYIRALPTLEVIIFCTHILSVALQKHRVKIRASVDFIEVDTRP